MTDAYSPCKTSNWYPSLANYTFPTSFLRLNAAEITAMKGGELKGKVADGVIEKLREPMSYFPGNSFVFTELAAPTDTVRFEKKRGAVYSAVSAWRFLLESEKIRNLAQQDLLEYICIRPFRRMNKTREFRLFIHDGKLKAMSQYWLLRHNRRIEKLKGEYWEQAKAFIDEIAWNLPAQAIVMDIYFTSESKILIVDFNPWGEPTDPLLLRDWGRDWSAEIGIELIAPPTTISGDVSVSF